MGEDASGPLVWARKNVSLRTCPKPYITAESQTLVEEFFVRRRLRGMDIAELSARQAEAFVILERALANEINDGQHNTR
jgi:DNA replicative helicase MCM subunit Mcm2 (Cdc46/Mcm family)